ncbi:MAG: AAA family ATPase [Nitrososphaerales archaeon]
MTEDFLFTIGEPASPEHLINRYEEVEDLVALLSNEAIVYNVAVLGYRRIGKTSILNKVEQQLKRKNIIVVRFDVKKNIGSPETFFNRLNTEIFSAYVNHVSRTKRIERRAGRVADQIIQKLTHALTMKKVKGISFETSITQNGKVLITPKIEFQNTDARRKNEAPDYQKIMETIFASARLFAEESDARFVIMLDEFQDILRLRRYRGLKNILDLFRSVMQERGSNVSYVICGSRVHMLKEFLHEGRSSVFMHFKEYPIDELKQPDAIKLFRGYIKARGLELDKDETTRLAEEAFTLAGGHPFYLMSLADSFKEKENISDTLRRELKYSNGTIGPYEEYVLAEDIEQAQGGPILKTILQFLATSRDQHGELIPSTGTEIANLLSRPLQQIEPYLKELVRYDLIVKNDANKSYKIRDTVLEQYLRLETEELDKKIEV